MTENESVKFFLRLVQEKHALLKSRLNDLFQALSSDNHDEKVNANSLLLEAGEDLSRVLSADDTPSWLNSIIGETNLYSEKHNTSGHNFRLLNNIVGLRNQALNHTWDFDKSSIGNDYNFDVLYQKFKADSKLPELFESMISTLEEMISSGEIDSLTALSNLEQLISVIKQNKDGSYFSIMTSWEFLTSFTNNLIWQELSSLPGIKQFKTAFEKTVKDMDIELVSLHKSIADEMKNKYETTIQLLTYKGNNLLEHNPENENSNK
ncbi:MAG: hypothetical protein KZQ75_02090 [Candidatus Thiodiazotropha sp. (ex Myrtea spinifera)]|nr:hypothetical protein [Candidatus Thiodiazotropha sp. (ex Myrtea spinifera)]